MITFRPLTAALLTHGLHKMILRIVTVLLCFIFICCKPKVIESAKDVNAAEIQMELKNLWVLLEDYRSTNGHFPQTLSDLNGIDPASLSKWDYTPNATPVVAKSISNQSGTLWLLSADGKIRKTLPESIK